MVGFVAVCLASLMGQTAQAGLFDVSSNFTVTGTNFPTDFSESVAVSSLPTLINSGKLSLRTTVFADGPNAEWVDFSYSTTNGGPLASNLNGNWDVEQGNLHMTQPTLFDGIYQYWTIDGVAVNPIHPFGGGSLSNVTPNPVNPLIGPVYSLSFAPIGPLTLFGNIGIFSDPYSFISAGGIDPTKANDFHYGVHLSAANPTAVPEPSSLTLLGLGGLGVIAWSRRRKRAVA